MINKKLHKKIKINQEPFVNGDCFIQVVRGMILICKMIMIMVLIIRMIMMIISKVKLATIVEGYPKAPFSIAYYTKV